MTHPTPPNTELDALKKLLGEKICGGYSYNPDDENHCEDCKNINDAVEEWNTRHLATLREDGGGEKPAVFYCENGKNLAGLEQGALAVLSNLMMKTNAQTAEFMIANEKDGEFHFTCRRGAALKNPSGAGGE